MGKFKGRSTVACTACHSQKLKCSGTSPCTRCTLRKRECVYPKKETYVTVPESYLREIEGEANSNRQLTAAEASSSAEAESSFSASMRHEAGDYYQADDLLAAGGHLQEDCSAERLIQKLKDLSSSLHPFVQSDLCQPPEPRTESDYTHLRLKSDFQHSDIFIKLPPKPYTFHLLDIFEEIFCDFHWFLRRNFRERLCLTYSDPNSQSGDRNWFCRVSVVLALAQGFKSGQDAPSPHEIQSSQGADGHHSSTLPAGSNFFEQAVLLFKTSSEQPVLGDIEALNLMAFYCYCLNRRETAFVYASQSIALAKLLYLNKQQPYRPKDVLNGSEPPQRVTDEHMRRLWWTSYCMDRMVATELGLSPTHWTIPPRLQPPSSSDLGPEDLDQFFDPAILVAQIQVCEIKRNVADTVTGLLQTSDHQSILDAIQPCFELLQNWKESLPAHMVLNFDSGRSLLALPCARGLASLYLRYNQCFNLLLRPIYLQELSSIVRERFGKPAQNLNRAGNQIQAIKIHCLNAVRNSCIILKHLATHGKLANFSYWDSIHTFSALATISLSKIPSIDPSGPTSDADARLYSECRAILENMARSGNPAVEHESLLTKVENMVKEVSSRAGLPMMDGEATITEPAQLHPSFGDVGFYEFITDRLWWDTDGDFLAYNYS
ncbi:hypothetical protein B0T10DRAFT_575332 [Thelonectria olida]|uniref:Zn(2)-C6 fungal-type domain-containing protein n=1 Tax=Thelonectria olida TaxID=1576542 RepID=A0A9P8W3D7_9HYPO|nr:hypothetical protein B0T10DRAFT_575332 [Thelonectria olida]